MQAHVSWKLALWQSYFTSRCKRIPTCTFHISWQIWMMFDTEDLCIMLMSKCEFCKNWFNESHILLMDISKMLPIFSTFLSDVMNGIQEGLHMKSYNWLSPTTDIQHFSITLHDQFIMFSTQGQWAYTHYCQYFPDLLSKLGKIQ